MSEETEIGAQTFVSSSKTIELWLRQEPKMDTPVNETSTGELTLGSLDKRIKKATDSNIKRVEELCVLLAGRTEMESAENSEASGSRRSHESISLSRNRYDTDSGFRLAVSTSTPVTSLCQCFVGLALVR